MSQPFATPQQAEDAFYDALEERNDALMMRVWDDSPDIALLLPMQPFIHGGQVRNVIRDLLRSDVPLDIQVATCIGSRSATLRFTTSKSATTPPVRRAAYHPCSQPTRSAAAATAGS